MTDDAGSLTTEKTHVARAVRWVGEWVETLRVAPPFSRRRRDLLATLRDDNLDNWIEAERPFKNTRSDCCGDGRCGMAGFCVVPTTDGASDA